MTPGALSMAAAHGHTELDIHPPPRLAFISTGNEIVPAEVQPEPGQIRDSHTDFLLSAARGLGVELTRLGIATDHHDSLAALFKQGLHYDVLLISGGVSMGKFDLVEEVLSDLGCEILFDKVAVQPGKPLVAATHPQGLIFGLPGNPASVMVCFWLFVRPALRRLMGFDDRFWNGALAATLAAPLPGAKGRDRFLPAEIDIRDGRLFAAPVGPKGSHDLSAFARGTALVRIRAHSQPADAGQACEVLPIGGHATAIVRHPHEAPPA